MFLLDRIPGLAWVSKLVRFSPYIALGVLLAALVVQRHTVTRITAERDRIIRVVDPSGKATPDQALAAAQRIVAERDAAKSALTTTTANYRLATAKAQAADLAHARAVEQRDAAFTGKVQHDLQAQLAGARADADAYARRLRARDAATAASGADRGGGGATGVPGPADPAGGAARARAAAELDDARICAANTVFANGWQRWWGGVSGAPR